MGAEQAKQLQNLQPGSRAEPRSPSCRENTQTPALSIPQSEMIGIAELRIKEPALGEVQLNSLTSRENKRKLKGTRDMGKQGELEDWVDEVINIDMKKSKEEPDSIDKENHVRAERKYDSQRQRKSRVSKML